jgi:hypothetical protein
LFPGNGQFIIQAAVPQQQQAPGQIVTSIPQQATIVQNRQVPTVVQTSQVIEHITTSHLVPTTVLNSHLFHSVNST